MLAVQVWYLINLLAFRILDNWQAHHLPDAPIMTSAYCDCVNRAMWYHAICCHHISCLILVVVWFIWCFIYTHIYRWTVSRMKFMCSRCSVLCKPAAWRCWWLHFPQSSAEETSVQILPRWWSGNFRVREYVCVCLNRIILLVFHKFSRCQPLPGQLSHQMHFMPLAKVSPFRGSMMTLLCWVF